MKIDELERIAKENDYVFNESLEYKTITLTREISVDGFITNHITINSNTENQIFIENVHCDDKDLNMIKAAVKFAETPIEEREGEKKFYLEHRYFKYPDGGSKYFTYNRFSDTPNLGCIYFEEIDNAKFTLKEIEEIKEKFNTDLADFELGGGEGMTFRPDPKEWENKKMTEPSVGGDFGLKTLDNVDLINIYRDYDVFYAHWIATNRLGKLEDALTLRKLEEWHEDYWDCIWFRRNKEYSKEFFEPVYIGNPLDTNFPEDEAEFFIQIPMLFDEELVEVEE